MIFISKMIFDPREGQLSRNRMGRTLGLVFYTPKFWNCRQHDFDLGWFWGEPPLPESVKELRYESWRAHRSCGWPYQHVHDRGYLYWIGPKRRYDLRYMGSTHPRWKWWQAISITKHCLYTRLLDNGPQIDTGDPFKDDPKIQEFRRIAGERRREQAAQIKREMVEYRAQREATR